ncbi:MAG: peptidoglycan DD-metalloendopeptidase family protein [Nitrospinae bacterium]|nr:peptidoglycan DD-metalloendopeptidase family protein [Nitrospinota bacterium]
MRLCSLAAAAAILAVTMGVGCASREAIRKKLYEPEDAVTAPDGRRYHVIKKGETLYRISRMYGVSVEEIKRINNITDVSAVEAGTRIYLPPSARGARPRPAPAGAPDEAPAKTDVRFAWPVKEVDISSRYGIRHNYKHDGLDLRGRRGEPVYAAAKGTVIFAGVGPAGYGNMVIIKHDERTISVYAHNDRNLAAKGQEVAQGEQIATIGRSGRATGYHMHFEIRIDRKPVDPERYLPIP